MILFTGRIWVGFSIYFRILVDIGRYVEYQTISVLDRHCNFFFLDVVDSKIKYIIYIKIRTFHGRIDFHLHIKSSLSQN